MSTGAIQPMPTTSPIIATVTSVPISSGNTIKTSAPIVSIVPERTTDDISTLLETTTSPIISTVPERTTDDISTLLETTTGAISSLPERTTGPIISTVPTTTSGAISSLPERTTGAISTVPETTTGAISTVPTTTTGAISTLPETTTGAIYDITIPSIRQSGPISTSPSSAPIIPGSGDSTVVTMLKDIQLQLDKSEKNQNTIFEALQQIYDLLISNKNPTTSAYAENDSEFVNSKATDEDEEYIDDIQEGGGSYTRRRKRPSKRVTRKNRL